MDVPTADQAPQESELPPAAPHDDLSIIGLGASAGGLRAIKQFFEHMQADSGMAFVVILHLSPDYESNLASLIQNSTTMPVTQVTETELVLANHVYVIPPTKHLSMSDGHLQLSEPERQRGRHVAIDLFFRTLAETHGKNAAAIVLSGTGSDGTIGLKRIKEMGGVTFAQDPSDAEYDTMPRSAIGTGLVDFVLPAVQMPAQLLAYRLDESRIRLPAPEQTRFDADVDTEALHEIFVLLRSRTGHDFANYKRATMLRRIGRRLQVNGLSDLSSYVMALRERPGEVEALLRNLLISVTNFFRDYAAFDALEAAVPRLFADKMTGEQLRVWVTGCATGEEAYSVAILLREYADRLARPPEIQIFATDIDEDAIAAAREGLYLDTIVADVTPERLARFFTKEQSCYRIKPELRDMVLFAAHNLLRDPPFSKLDLITCRNLLIYLERGVQEQIIQLFHFVLRPNGLLLLGASEFADGMPDLLMPIDKQQRLFTSRAITRTAPTLPTLPLSGPPRRKQPLPEASSPRDILSFSALHVNLLEQYAPPSAIVNEAYDILHLSAHAGRFLQFSGGEPSYNLLKVVHADLRIELRTALFRAQKNGRNETRQVAMRIDNQIRLVNLIVRPVKEPEAAQGFVLVIFDEVGETSDASVLAEVEPVAHHLDEELQRTKDSLRSTVEQYETSIEELRASNEELQAINEELRSTTEELETSKEELQSINEELRTVNQELKNKVEEVSRVNSDLQNFLAATDIGTLFLDRSLRLMRYTPRAEQLFNLIPADMHRPLSHITHRLNYDRITDDAALVIERLATIEREVQSDDGRWYIARFLPYRTVDDRIGGVVLTFVDITERKRAIDAELESRQQTELILESITDSYAQVDQAWRCVYMNRAKEQLLHLRRDQVLGKDIRQVYAQMDIAPYLDRFEQAMQQRVEVAFEASYATLKLTVEVRIFPTNDGGLTIYQRDITERKRAEERWKVGEERLLLLNENVRDYAITMLDTAGRFIDWNVGAERMFGYTSEEMLGQDGARIFTPEDVANGAIEQELELAAKEGRAEDERWHLRKDGSRLWVSGIMSALRDEAGQLQGFSKVARDMTEERNTEAALRESEARLRIALDAAQMGTWDWDIINSTTIVNQRYYELFGIPLTNFTNTIGGGAFREHIHPEDQQLVASSFTPAIERGQIYACEFRVIWPDGSVHWLASEGRSHYDSDQAMRMTGVLTEITSRKEAEAAIRRSRDELELSVQARTHELAETNAALQKEIIERIQAQAARTEVVRQLVTAEEDERRRISRELHDQMGQQLIALLLGLQTLKSLSHGRSKSLQVIEQLHRFADAIGEEVHKLALQLRPTALDDLGLSAALANYVDDWSQRTQVKVEFHSRGLEYPRPVPEIETTLYRVVLEALTNVAKHAQASHVSIILERRDNQAIAIVEDNGRGFDTERVLTTLRQEHRLGLLGMQERAAQVGGTLTIESASEGGTTVIIRIPLVGDAEGSNHVDRADRSDRADSAETTDLLS